jgi:hypothetical protein
MKIDLKNIEKPSKKDIEDWVNNKLMSEDERKQVILGLLVHKDEATQGYLEEVLSGKNNLTKVKESIFEWFNGVVDNISDEISKTKDAISIVFQPSEAGLSPMMMGKPKKHKGDIDFKLLGNKVKSDQKDDISNYRVSLKSNTDFELKIKLPDGKFLVTLLYANSSDECGFIYPKLDKSETPIVEGAQLGYSVLEKGDYELIKDESSTFKLTIVRYSDQEYNTFKKCIQLGEEMGVVRWLRHIEMDKDNKYSVATIFIEAK